MQLYIRAGFSSPVQASFFLVCMGDSMGMGYCPHVMPRPDPLHTISKEQYSIWSWLIHLCKMMISPGIFFSFSNFFIFWVVRGVKEQKTFQNDKKFSPSRFISQEPRHLWHSISQEPYIIWLSFMVHMCKMIISPEVFFIFSKFWFFGLLGG